MVCDNIEEYVDKVTQDIRHLEANLTVCHSQLNDLKVESDQRIFENISMSQIEKLIGSTPSISESGSLQRLLRDAKAFQEKIREKQLIIDRHTLEYSHLSQRNNSSEVEKSKMRECVNRLSQQLAELKARPSVCDKCSAVTPDKRLVILQMTQTDAVSISDRHIPEPLKRIDALEVVGNQVEETVKHEPQRYAKSKTRASKQPVISVPIAIRNYNIRDD